MGYAQAGLKKYDDAITSYKKAVDLETASKKPRLQVIGLADAGLGEVYARTGKVPEANAAYDASAKADPADAALNLRNEAIIFFQENNAAAQVAAADEAIKVDPNQAHPLLHQGPGTDPERHHRSQDQDRIVLPPDCIAAYQKYLELAPTGQFANEVAGHSAAGGRKGQFLLQGATKIKVAWLPVCSSKGVRYGGRPSCLEPRVVLWCRQRCETPAASICPAVTLYNPLHESSCPAPICSATMRPQRWWRHTPRNGPGSSPQSSASRSPGRRPRARAALRADRDQPPFARSTRDGFACRAAEASRARAARRCRLHPRRASSIRPAAARRRMGDHDRRSGSRRRRCRHDARARRGRRQPSKPTVRLLPPRTVEKGENIVARGAQARKGDELLPAGTAIGAGADGACRGLRLR